MRDNNNEWGWAYTVAYRYNFTPRVAWLNEALYIKSDRTARAYLALDDYANQLTLQSSLRLYF